MKLKEKVGSGTNTIDDLVSFLRSEGVLLSVRRLGSDEEFSRFLKEWEKLALNAEAFGAGSGYSSDEDFDE
jgi:hypothetical protein